MPQRLLTTYQVADLLGATPGAVVEWIQKGLLPVERQSDGSLRTPQEALVEFLVRRGEDSREVLARLGVNPPPAEPSDAPEAEMPRLDFAEPTLQPQALAGSSPPQAGSVERMFPLNLDEEEAGPFVATDTAVETTDQEGTPPTTEQQDGSPPQEGDTEPPTKDTEPLPQLADADEPAEAAEPAEPFERIEEDSVGEEPPLERGQYVPAPAAQPEVVQPTDTPAPLAQPAIEAPTTLAEPAVNLIRSALGHRASEIHIENTATGISVRLRMDGWLYEAAACGLSISDEDIAKVSQQLRSFAALPADAHRPGRGQANLTVADRTITMSIAACPTPWGQRLVVALRDTAARRADLGMLALPTATQGRLARILSRSHGLVVLGTRCGPERTAVLEAIVSATDPAARSVVMLTDEDTSVPPGATPIATDPIGGFGDVQAIETLTAQHADVIVAEDVREADVYTALLSAAARGPLTVAGTEKFDAASIVSQLLAMPLPADLLADCLKAVATCVPVRRLCPHCCKPVPPSEELLAAIGLSPQDIPQAFGPVGCGKCYGSGYLGMVGCSSALLVDRNLASVIRTKPTPQALADGIARAGTTPLIEVAAEMVRQGTTTLSELARALPE